MSKPSTQKINPIDIYKYFLRVTFSFPRMATASLVIMPITIILERYIAPLIIAVILNDIQHGTVTIESSLWLIVIYGALQLFAQVIGYRLNLYLMWTVQVKGAKKIYDESYEKLTLHSLNFFNNHFVGSIVSQSNKLATAYMGFWNLVTNRAIMILTSLVATIIGLALIMWQFALVVLVLVVLFILAASYGMRFMRPRFIERSESYSKISGALSDSLSNMLAVKADGMEDYEIHGFKKHSTHMVHTELRARSGFVAVSSFYSSIIALMRIGALIASVAAIQYDFASAGLVYICLTYTFNLIEEIWNFNDIIREHYRITSDSEEMFGFMRQSHDVKDSSHKKLAVTAGDVSFDMIQFAHADAGDTLFKDFTLHIPAGQKVGIVGVSGSGKTTLTKILMRFMDIDSGSITIDGQDISDVSQKSLRSVIAYVPQEPLLFHRTLSENIRYSNQQASDEEVYTAARKAHADEFIKTLADGYNTPVGERGVKLSGGQRQRIAIARAILKDAPILVLDEATSALDSESEVLIQRAIENLWQNKTSIVIAHRLSTIAKLDRIIVMDKGNIIEDGTHTDLLKKKGTYAKLWSHQSGGFIEE